MGYFFKLSFTLCVLSVFGLSACGGGITTDGVCSLEEKADAQSVLKDLSAEEIAKAVASGCASSKENKDEFMSGVLGDLSVDPACASDTDLQSIVDNWEGADLSNIPSTCGETPSPSESPIDPEIVAITVAHDVLLIAGRGYYLTLQLSEPVKTETASIKLQILTSAVTQEGGDIAKTYQDLDVTESEWNDDRKSLSIRIPTTPHYGSYLFTIKASGDAEGHQADASFEFSIDQDGDGVVDKDDECDGTPAATENGCPADAGSDSDGDGVTDNLDKCPTTKAGEPVDATGCAKAADETIWIVAGNIWSYTINPAMIAKLFPEPKVIESIPPRDATSVPTNWPIVIKFNQPMDLESVKQHVKLKLYWVLSWKDVPMNFVTSYGDCNEQKQCNVFEFKPQSPLKANAIYGIVIEKGIKGVNGESNVEDSWAFQTK